MFYMQGGYGTHTYRVNPSHLSNPVTLGPLLQSCAVLYSRQQQIATCLSCQTHTAIEILNQNEIKQKVQSHQPHFNSQQPHMATVLDRTDIEQFCCCQKFYRTALFWRLHFIQSEVIIREPTAGLGSMKDGWHMGQGHNFVVPPGCTAYLTSMNLSFLVVKVEIRYLPCRSVTRARVDVCGRSRKGLITLQMMNNSKYCPWFPSLGMSHTKFCVALQPSMPLTLKVWFSDHEHYLQPCQTSRLSGFTLELLHQNLHFNKTTR